MSKCALLMFGQPRYVEECFPNIYRCLIEPNNPDTFIHMWNDPPQDKPFRAGEGWKNERLTKDAAKTVLDLYKPKSVCFESQIEFPHDGVDFTNTLRNNMGGGAERQEISKHYVFATHSMWYSIQQVFKLIHKRKYDGIILTRFDLGIQHQVKLDTYDLNAVWGEGINRPELLLNWMNFGNQRVMEIVFSNMYFNIKTLYKELNIWCNEYWCKNQADYFKIPTREGNWGLSIPSRNL